MSCAPDMMKIQTFRSERDMDDVGMHVQKSGERHVRSPNHKSNGTGRFETGLRKIRDRARRLSNAVGYDSKDAPRTQRKPEQR